MNEKIRLRLTISLIIGALILCIVGIAGGEMGDILQYAANICLECIGIG